MRSLFSKRVHALVLLALSVVSSSSCSLINLTNAPCQSGLNCSEVEQCIDGRCTVGNSRDGGLPQTDAGLLDAGPLDAGPLDGGGDDGGMADGGGNIPDCLTGQTCSDTLLANCDRIAVLEDTEQTFDPRSNDCGPVSGIGFAGLVSQPVQGTVFVNPDGTLRYEPYPNVVTRATAPDRFIYRIIDLNGNVDQATVYVDVEADPTPDPLAGATTRYLVPLASTVDLPLALGNPDNLAAEWTFFGGAQNGVVIDGAAGHVTFTEAAADDPGQARELIYAFSANLGTGGVLSTMVVEVAAAVWVGAGAWDDANNWLPASIPAAGASVIIAATPTMSGPALDRDVTIGTLRVDEGMKVDLRGNELRVRGDLFLPTEASGIVGMPGSLVTLVDDVDPSPRTVAWRGRLFADLVIARPVLMTADGAVEGNLMVTPTETMASGLTLGFHRLDVGGDFTFTMLTADDFLTLDDPRARLDVGGDFSILATGLSGGEVPQLTLSGGVLRVGGDFLHQEGPGRQLLGVEANGTELQFPAGEHRLEVTFFGGFTSASYLGRLGIESDAVVTFDDLVTSGYLNLDDNALLNGETLEVTTHLPPGLPGLQTNLLVVRDAVQLIRPTRLSGALSILSNGAYVASVDANDDLLEIGDPMALDGHLTVDLDDAEDGLFMGPGSQVNVNGNWNVDLQSASASNGAGTRLLGGTLDILGDFSQTSPAGDGGERKAFQPNGTRVRLRGSGARTVSFIEPDIDQSFFDRVAIAGSSTVTFTTDVVVAGLLQVNNPVTGSTTLTLYQAILVGSNGTVTFDRIISYNADFPLIDDRWNLGTFEVAASAMINDDIFMPMTRLLIETDATATSVDVGANRVEVGSLSQRLTDVSAGILLDNPEAELVIRGDAEFATFGTGSTFDRFRDGELTIEGNVIVNNASNGLDMSCTVPCNGVQTRLGAQGKITVLGANGNVMTLSHVTVVSGATVVIPDDAIINIAGNFRLEGTLVLETGATLNVPNGVLTYVSGCGLSAANGTINATAGNCP